MRLTYCVEIFELGNDEFTIALQLPNFSTVFISARLLGPDGAVIASRRPLTDETLQFVPSAMLHSMSKQSVMVVIQIESNEIHIYIFFNKSQRSTLHPGQRISVNFD